MYNGFDAGFVTSGGAYRNDISVARDRTIGRGVLLDLPRVKGLPYLELGYAITRVDLEQACSALNVQVGTGDFVLVRTGHVTQVRQRGDWATCAGGDAPGLEFFLSAQPLVVSRAVGSCLNPVAIL